MTDIEKIRKRIEYPYDWHDENEGISWVDFHNTVEILFEEINRLREDLGGERI